LQGQDWGGKTQLRSDAIARFSFGRTLAVDPESRSAGLIRHSVVSLPCVGKVAFIVR
jgi:hypothetical protein